VDSKTEGHLSRSPRHKVTRKTTEQLSPARQLTRIIKQILEMSQAMSYLKFSPKYLNFKLNLFDSLEIISEY
jgi:hypothetical protein